VPLRILDPEIFGLTETSLTLTFAVSDGARPVDARAVVRVNGEARAISEGPAATRCLRIEGLAPDAEQRVEIEVRAAEPAERGRYFPDTVRTLPAPRAREVASFATLNDLHFGEPRFGGQLTEEREFGEEAPGFPAVRESDGDEPYWRFMNEDAVAEIDAAGPDCVVIKGDIADRGLPDQFEEARRCFLRLRTPWHAFLGNHDYYGRHLGQPVDGYRLLGQPPAPRSLDLGGFRLLLLETAEPGEHHGVFEGDRLRWLASALEETREAARPTLLLMHHQPVPPEHADTYPNTIGLVPDHSLDLFALVGAHPQVKGVLIGHTHRNRLHRHPSAGRVPFVEVNCTKDFPGGWAHYRLFEDGSFRQEVRRTSSDRALAHSTRCAEFFRGFYRHFALGPLEARSFASP
jgi:predicted phosphodiesterase